MDQMSVNQTRVPRTKKSSVEEPTPNGNLDFMIKRTYEKANSVGYNNCYDMESSNDISVPSKAEKEHNMHNSSSSTIDGSVTSRVAGNFFKCPSVPSKLPSVGGSTRSKTDKHPENFVNMESSRSMSSKVSSVTPSVRSKNSERLENSIAISLKSSHPNGSILSKGREKTESSHSNKSKPLIVNGSMKSTDIARLENSKSLSKSPSMNGSLVSRPPSLQSWSAYSIASSLDSASQFNPPPPVIVRRTCAHSTETNDNIDRVSCASSKTLTSCANSKQTTASRASVKATDSLDKISSVNVDKAFSEKMDSQVSHSSTLSRNMSIVSSSSSMMGNIEAEVEIPHYCPSRWMMPNWGNIPSEQLELADYLTCCQCANEFDRNFRTPLRLFCHHNMCDRCALDQLKVSFWDISCGRCSTLTRLPAAYRLQYLRVNTDLLDKVDQAKLVMNPNSDSI